METYVRLLGRPEIVHEGRTTTLQAEVRFRLFAVLAFSGAPVPRDRLAGLFWPDRDNATARRNLRKLVFDAGVFAWSASVESTRATLSWPMATDVALFERALAEGRYEDALTLHRGPLFESLDDPANNTFAAFLCRERRRLAQSWRTTTLQRLATLADEPRRALALANTLLAADPLDEDATAVALQALQSIGNTSDAVRLYRDYARRLRDMLGIEPSPRLRAFGCASAQAPARPSQPAGNRPANVFVGRDAESGEFTSMLRSSDCRLLTIVGPGGTGKSRFAKAALAAIEADFADGSWWIALDDLDGPEQVAERIVQTLGIRCAGRADPLQCLSAWLREKRTLLVLDNAERIVALPPLIERLLAGAPGLKVLATSRHRLGSTGEWLLPLAGLAVPPIDPMPHDAADYAAVRLFAAQARCARPAFNLAAVLPQVVRIVRALGGLPLAIELAARWLRWLPVGGLEAEIATSLDLLERDEEGDERPEHRSVRATFEVSWLLLAAQEQRSFAMLSVFAGAFTRPAAQRVSGVTLPALASLVDRSLVQAHDNGRFSLNPLLRQFGTEKCGELGLVEAAGAGHADWFHAFLAQRCDALAAGKTSSLDDVAAEIANCLGAWRWSLARHETGALARTAAPLVHFFLLRGRLSDGLHLFNEAAASLDPDRDEDRLAAASVLLALARLQGKRGGLVDAAGTARRALKLGRSLGLEDVVSGCLEVFLESLWQRGLYPGARQRIDAGLRRARVDDDDTAVATFHCRAAALEEAHGNHLQAQTHYAEALRRTRQLGEPSALAWLLKSVGNLHCVRGEWQLALAALQEGLDLCERQGVRLGSVHFMLSLALVRHENRQFAAADDLCRQAFELAREIGVPAIEAAVRLVRGRLAIRRGDTRAALSQVRTAATLILALRDESVGLDCVRSFAEVLLASRASEERPVATALLNYVVRHPRTEAADRAAARARLGELAARIDETVDPTAVAVGTLLRRIADGAAAGNALAPA